jgi:hypothetical protein
MQASTYRWNDCSLRLIFLACCEVCSAPQNAFRGSSRLNMTINTPHVLNFSTNKNPAYLGREERTPRSRSISTHPKVRINNTIQNLVSSECQMNKTSIVHKAKSFVGIINGKTSNKTSRLFSNLFPWYGVAVHIFCSNNQSQISMQNCCW